MKQRGFTFLEISKMPSGKANFSAGFTLIELMLASLIMSLVMASVYVSFGGCLRAWKEGNSRAERHQMVQIALEEISRQLRAAYIAPDNPEIEFVGDLETMDFVYATARSEEGEQRGYGLCSVNYWLTTEEESEPSKLMRRERMIPYAAEFPSVSSEEVMDSVFNLSFRYYSQDGWQESWNSNRDLPQTVQINFVLEDETGSTEAFSTMVDIPAGG